MESVSKRQWSIAMLKGLLSYHRRMTLAPITDCDREMCSRRVGEDFYAVALETAISELENLENQQ